MQARAGEGEQGGSCGSLKARLALHIHSSYLELFILERLLSDVFDGAWSRQVGSKGLWCLFNLTSSTERRIWELPSPSEGTCHSLHCSCTADALTLSSAS